MATSWTHAKLKVITSVRGASYVKKYTGVIYVPITSGTYYTYVKTVNPTITKHKGQFFIEYDRIDPVTGFSSNHIGVLDVKH
jgi:hypothetical protein